MKITKLLVVVFVILSSIPLFAQQADANTQQNTSARAGAAQVSGSGAADAQITRSGANAQTQGSSSANGAASTAGPFGLRRHNARPSSTATMPQSSNSRAVAQRPAPRPMPRAQESQAPRDGARSASSAGSAEGVLSGVGSNGAAALQPVRGELERKLDSKSARVGQEVVVKTTQAFRTADGLVLPKGTRLVGRVTSVQPHRSRKDDGGLGLQFDRAVLKGGRTVPIRSAIESVSPPASGLALADSGDDEMFAAPVGGGTMAGGAMGGGSLIGGGRTLGGGAGALAPVQPRMVNTSLPTSGAGFAAARRSTVGSADDLTSRANGAETNVRGTTGAGAATAARATAIPGVMLAGDASGAASGTLTAVRKNVHLNSGTQMVLGVAAAAKP